MKTDLIETLAQLRALYLPAKERALKKQLNALEMHCINFIGLSPLVVLSSSDASGTMDASPRGGVAGFVKVVNSHTILIPDAAGNNRLDTLENIVSTGKLGLLFLVPGVDETLRLNGQARLSISAQHRKYFEAEKKPPKLVIEVHVQEVFLHCAKALMRSRLWDASLHVDRSALPSMGEMMKSQIGVDGPAETQEEMLARYAADL
jgi:uncharacterized protein